MPVDAEYGTTSQVDKVRKVAVYIGLFVFAVGLDIILFAVLSHDGWRHGGIWAIRSTVVVYRGLQITGSVCWSLSSWLTCRD